jgi:hypothetical protein
VLGGRLVLTFVDGHLLSIHATRRPYPELSLIIPPNAPQPSPALSSGFGVPLPGLQVSFATEKIKAPTRFGRFEHIELLRSNVRFAFVCSKPLSANFAHSGLISRLSSGAEIWIPLKNSKSGTETP